MISEKDWKSKIVFPFRSVHVQWRKREYPWPRYLDPPEGGPGAGGTLSSAQHALCGPVREGPSALLRAGGSTLINAMKLWWPIGWTCDDQYNETVMTNTMKLWWSTNDMKKKIRSLQPDVEPGFLCLETKSLSLIHEGWFVAQKQDIRAIWSLCSRDM